MKYYIFHGSIDNKVVGKYPQSDSVALYGNLHEIGFETPLSESNVILQEPILHEKTILTSYLDITSIERSIYMIIDKELNRFILDFKIPKFSTLPLRIIRGNQIVSSYFLLHVSFPFDKLIVNYEKSEFLMGKLGDWRNPNIREPIKIDCYEDYIALKNKLKEESGNREIRCHKLILDFTKTDFDLLRLANVPIGARYYMSEKLKNAIEEKGFTGFDFKEIEEINSKIKVIY